MRAVYEALAAPGTRVRVSTSGLYAAAGRGVEGTALGEDEPLASECTLVVVGIVGYCFATRDLLTAAARDAYGNSEWALTRDRDVVVRVARLLGLDETVGLPS